MNRKSKAEGANWKQTVMAAAGFLLALACMAGVTFMARAIIENMRSMANVAVESTSQVAGQRYALLAMVMNARNGGEEDPNGGYQGPGDPGTAPSEQPSGGNNATVTFPGTDGTESENPPTDQTCPNGHNHGCCCCCCCNGHGGCWGQTVTQPQPQPEPTGNGLPWWADRIEGNNYIYLVKWGDTLSYVSTITGWSVDALGNHNNLRNVHLIYAGSALRVPMG